MSVRYFFSSILISKMSRKKNLRIITKNYADDSEKGLLKKSISKPYGRATVMPTAWELTKEVILRELSLLSIQPYIRRNINAC